MAYTVSTVSRDACCICGERAVGYADASGHIAYCYRHMSADRAGTQRMQQRATDAHWAGVMLGRRNAALVDGIVIDGPALRLPSSTEWGDCPPITGALTVRDIGMGLLMVEDGEARSSDGLRGLRIYVGSRHRRFAELAAIPAAPTGGQN